MMWDAQIVEQFTLRQMPNEQRERLLGFIATDENPAKNLEMYFFCKRSRIQFDSPSIARDQQ